uniref:Kinesin-like protein n=1 Tax=Syphacia muris TaxID=451379 RepID=A0A0N5AP36_9BILA
MPDGENVVVAVRVRPFNSREKSLNCKKRSKLKAQLIISMPDSNRTVIRDPNNPDEDPKVFSFDHSYWSHDGYKENGKGYFEAVDDRYADQQKVYDDLGKGVLDNAWKGYNCCLFAYGQTGSGKSYSMVGDKNNKGIIPIVCEQLFKQIDEKRNNNNTDVSISMYEIYCEKVRDLLSNEELKKGGLKIREHPKNGFYVEGLKSVPVNSYKEIEKKMDQGTKQRTIAATNMNANSSRAHTIVKIQFTQKIGKKGDPGNTTKTSQINLVDLAGSERQKSAGSEGDRLKEGIVINQSLSTLGRVIKALHEQQTSKKKKNLQIPYRDSVLTSLLKNALGGNSKTIMIAALSPADLNYEETLSTLRFADRTKSIKTNAVVNESATERMIRELKEENARLQQMIQNGGSSGDADEIESLRKQLEENQKEMAALEETWQQRLEAEKLKEGGGDERVQISERRKKDPHFYNLNEDPALTDMIVHFIEKGKTTIGNKDADPPANIQLNGLSIQPEHAVLSNTDNKKVILKAVNGAKILVNGQLVVNEVQLQTDDRILFGGNHLYVFVNPKSKSKKGTKITYEMAQQEIAQNSLLSGGSGKKSTADLILEEDMIQIMPNVVRANSISQELKKNVTFEIVLLAPEARGLNEGLTEIWIKVYNNNEKTYVLWDKNRFLSRYYGMEEMYQNYLDGDTDWELSKERDPFYESPSTEFPVASATIFLKSLAFMIEYEHEEDIRDFHGNVLGMLSVSLTPCTAGGKDIIDEFVENPYELVGQNVSFKVRIKNCSGLPQNICFLQSRCKYRFFNQPEIETKYVSGKNPEYNHEAVFTFRPVSNKKKSKANTSTNSSNTSSEKQKQPVQNILKKSNEHLDAPTSSIKKPQKTVR